MTQQQQNMYLEVVSVSMKSQNYEIPDQASVLLSTSNPGFNFSKQTKSLAHLDAATYKQWWIFKEVFAIPTAMKEQKLQIKLYGSSTTASSSASASVSAKSPSTLPSTSTSPKKTQQQNVKLKIPKGNTSRLELCIGNLEVALSSLQGGVATTFEASPVSLLSHEDSKEKQINILKRSVTSTVTLRLVSEPPPAPPLSAALDSVVVRDKVEDEDAQGDEDSLLGTVRVVVWQGKNLNTDYPVFLDTRMNQKTVRRSVTMKGRNMECGLR